MYTRGGERGEGIISLEKEKLSAPDFFRASTAEKTAVGAGKNCPFAYCTPEKGMPYVLEL